MPLFRAISFTILGCSASLRRGLALILVAGLSVMAMQEISKLLRFGYECLIWVGELLQPLIILVFRLQFGWVLFKTGKGKLLNHDHVVQFFTSLGIPLPELNAWFVGGLECLGGLLLVLGLCSRPIALMLTVNMLVAYISVAEDRAALLGVLNDPEPFLSAAPFFFLLTSLLVLAFGPGVVSVDAWLKKRLSKKSQNSD